MNKEKTYLYLEAENPGSGAHHLASDEDLSMDDITVADTGQRGSLKKGGVVGQEAERGQVRLPLLKTSLGPTRITSAPSEIDVPQ